MRFLSKEAKAFRNALGYHRPRKHRVDPKLQRQTPFPVTDKAGMGKLKCIVPPGQSRR